MRRGAFGDLLIVVVLPLAAMLLSVLLTYFLTVG